MFSTDTLNMLAFMIALFAPIGGLMVAIVVIILSVLREDQQRRKSK